MLTNMGLWEGLYLRLHIWNFTRRKKRQVRFPKLRVLSVGNLSAGGTGKTPLSLRLAEEALRRGVPTGIALRGYKGSLSKKGVCFEGGKSHPFTAKEIGDEALLFARISGLQVMVGKDRASLLQRFANGLSLVILDDAFQNPLVYHDHELVLIDASQSPGSLHLIPRGKFREPISALERAHTVLLTRTEFSSHSNLANWKKAIANANPKIPVFLGKHEPQKIHPSWPRNNPAYGLLSGLGNPDSFYKSTLSVLGYEPEIQIKFKDHYLPSLSKLKKIHKNNSSLIWLTSEKDWVRTEDVFREFPEMQNKVHILPVRMKIVQKEKEFFDRLLGP